MLRQRGFMKTCGGLDAGWVCCRFPCQPPPRLLLFSFIDVVQCTIYQFNENDCCAPHWFYWCEEQKRFGDDARAKPSHEKHLGLH